MDEPAGSACYWRCPNCGQMNFSDEPPDMCDFCQDFTTWQRVSDRSERLDKRQQASQITYPHLDAKHRRTSDNE